MFMHNYAQFPYILFPTQMTCAVAYDMIIDQLPVFIHKYAQFPYIFSPTLVTCAVAYDVIVDQIIWIFSPTPTPVFVCSVFLYNSVETSVGRDKRSWRGINSSANPKVISSHARDHYS